MVVRLGQAAFKYVILTFFVRITYLWSATIHIVLVRALIFKTQKKCGLYGRFDNFSVCCSFGTNLCVLSWIKSAKLRGKLT